MQSASNGDNFHEMPSPVFGEKIRKNATNLLSAELAKRVIKIHLFCHIALKKTVLIK